MVAPRSEFDGANGVTKADVEALVRRIHVLEVFVARIRQAFPALDEDTVFGGYDGDFGTSGKAAREDHAH